MWAIFVLLGASLLCREVAGQTTVHCGTIYGCFHTPASCTKASTCKSLVLLRYDTISEVIEITLARQGTGWVAFGLNSKPSQMDQTSGEACIYDGSTVQLKSFVAKGNTAPDFNFPPSDVKVLDRRFTDGAVVCRYTRPVTPSRSSAMRSASRNWFLTSSYGIVDKGKPTYHCVGNYFSSVSPVNLTAAALVGETISTTHSLANKTASTSAIETTVAAHGCMMILAWAFFGVCGIFTARYLKVTWINSTLGGEKVWFQVHRTCMVLAWLLTLLSFTLIFTDVKALSDGPEEREHAIVGIVVTILAFLQPIMAVFRPHPGEQYRWLFNWGHWAVGTSAVILGEVNIILGLGLVKVTRTAIIIHIVVVVFLFIVAQIIAWRHSRTAGEEPITQTTEMTPEEARSETYIFIRARYCLLGFLVLFSGIIALTLLGLIIKRIKTK